MYKYIREYLEKAADENKNIYFVCMDSEEFAFCLNIKEKYPQRVILCGIQEQNALNIAIGLAAQGKKVYLCIAAIFLVRRAVDQLKLAAYSKLDINILALCSGIQLVKGGYSHFPIDEFSIISNTPNLEIYHPCNIKELENVMQVSTNKNTPKFISLSNYSSAVPDEINNDYSTFKGLDGNCILTVGGAAIENKFANYKQYFINNNLNPTIINYYNINNFDKNRLLDILKKYKNIVFIHYRAQGSLDYEITRLIAENNLKVKIRIFTMPYDKCDIPGNSSYYIENFMGFNKIADFFNTNKNPLIKRKVIQRNNLKYAKIKYKFLGIPYFKIVKNDNQISKKLFSIIPLK